MTNTENTTCTVAPTVGHIPMATDEGVMCLHCGVTMVAPAGGWPAPMAKPEPDTFTVTVTYPGASPKSARHTVHCNVCQRIISENALARSVEKAKREHRHGTP